MTKCAALILAGGRATRLGGADKPLLPLGPARLIDRIVAALAPDAASIAISANGEAARYAGVGLPVLPDRQFPGAGPLAGLLEGLDWAAAQDCPLLLTVPGDTPFIPTGLAAALAPAPACAASHGRTHPLVALWPVQSRFALAAHLARPGSRAAGRFSAMIGTRTVDFAACPDPFFNVNTQDELAAARLRAGA